MDTRSDETVYGATDTLTVSPVNGSGPNGTDRVVGQVLRDYQQQAVANTLDAWRNQRALVGVAATGLGKTTIMAELVRRTGYKTLFLAHREELVYQADERMRQFGLTTGIEMAGQSVPRRPLSLPHVVIATPQTLYSSNYKRMNELKPHWFDLVLVDECHHYIAPSYRKILAYYKNGNPNCKLLGVTATPDRHDNLALSNIFDGVAFRIGVHEGIEAGYLVPVLQQYVSIAGLDYSTVRVVAGDLSHMDVANILEQERMVIAFTDAMLKCCGQRKTLVFTESVKQAEMIAALLNARKPFSADWLHGGSADTHRRITVQKFRDGTFQFLVNCALFLEGFDDPGIECIVMAKPTRSRPLYCQMLGRGLRPLPGVTDALQTEPPETRRQAIEKSPKPNLLVIDFVGNSGRHKLVTALDILGGEKVSEEARRRAHQHAVRSGQAVNVEELLRKAEEEQKALVVADARFHVTYVDPFDVFQKRQEKWKGYRQRRPSKKQIRFLERNGYKIRGLSNEEILALWEKLWWAMNGATERQKQVISRFYPEADLSRMTRWEASKIIDTLAKNNWRRPDKTNKS